MAELSKSWRQARMFLEQSFPDPPENCPPEERHLYLPEGVKRRVPAEVAKRFVANDQQQENGWYTPEGALIPDPDAPQAEEPT